MPDIDWKAVGEDFEVLWSLPAADAKRGFTALPSSIRNVETLKQVGKWHAQTFSALKGETSKQSLRALIELAEIYQFRKRTILSLLCRLGKVLTTHRLHAIANTDLSGRAADSIGHLKTSLKILARHGQQGSRAGHAADIAGQIRLENELTKWDEIGGMDGADAAGSELGKGKHKNWAMEVGAARGGESEALYGRADRANAAGQAAAH